MNKYYRILLVVIASLSGLFVLLGYFLDYDRLGLTRFYLALYQAVVILAAVALLIGIINLFRTHWNKFYSKKPGGIYSLVLCGSMLATLVLASWLGPAASIPQWIFNYIQLPVEISLLAMLVVLLIMSAGRLLTRRPSFFSMVFLLTVLFLLISVASFQAADTSRFLAFLNMQNLRAWIMQVPVTGGVRGLLLGVALGTIATGLRLLVGGERPYEN